MKFCRAFALMAIIIFAGLLLQTASVQADTLLRNSIYGCINGLSVQEGTTQVQSIDESRCASSQARRGVHPRSIAVPVTHKSVSRAPAFLATLHTTRNNASQHRTPTHRAQSLNLPVYVPQGGASGDIGAGSLLDIAWKFVVVLALLFISLRVLRAVMPRLQGATPGKDGALVLHSESLGEKNRLTLLDFGAKIVAVGISGAGMTELATIDDEEGLAALRTQYKVQRGPQTQAESDGDATQLAPFAQALKTALQTHGLPTTQRATKKRTAKRAASVGAVHSDSSLTEDAALGKALERVRSLNRKFERR